MKFDWLNGLKRSFAAYGRQAGFGKPTRRRKMSRDTVVALESRVLLSGENGEDPNASGGNSGDPGSGGSSSGGTTQSQSQSSSSDSASASVSSGNSNMSVSVSTWAAGPTSSGGASSYNSASCDCNSSVSNSTITVTTSTAVTGYSSASSSGTVTTQTYGSATTSGTTDTYTYGSGSTTTVTSGNSSVSSSGTVTTQTWGSSATSGTTETWTSGSGSTTTETSGTIYSSGTDTTTSESWGSVTTSGTADTWTSASGSATTDTTGYTSASGTVTSTSESSYSTSISLTSCTTVPTKIVGTLTLDGDATSSAAKGMFTPEGETTERETTDAELIYWKYYYKQYDGPTQFTAEYTVNLNADGTFNPTGSTIKFTTVNYTSRYKLTVRDSLSDAQQAEEEAKGFTVYREGGKVYILKKATLLPYVWPTLSIPITEATLVDGKLHSFKFKGDWYSNLPTGFIDKGVEGAIDLAKCTAEFTAKYQEPYSGSIGTYVTTGKIKN